MASSLHSDINNDPGKSVFSVKKKKRLNEKYGPFCSRQNCNLRSVLIFSVVKENNVLYNYSKVYVSLKPHIAIVFKIPHDKLLPILGLLLFICSKMSSHVIYALFLSLNKPLTIYSKLLNTIKSLHFLIN